MQKVMRVLIFISVLGLLFLPGCKTSEEAGQYTLTVSVGEGITGTPADGTYAYSEGTTVNYSYALESGYENLAVTLDGAPVASSGTITVSGNHRLIATAEAETGFDIRGEWSGFLYWKQRFIPPPYPIIDVFLTVTFEGGLESGVATGYMDAGWGWSPGTYTVEGNQVSFNLEFYQGFDILYCGGIIENNNRMSGWYETGLDIEWNNLGWMLERK